MRIVVQKFGGTSVASQQGRENVATHVSRARIEGFCPVVVVSAMGRTGDPYATDSLLSLAKQEYPGIDPRDADLLISCGEIIAAVVVASSLRRAGIETTVFSGAQAGILTDGRFSDARVVRVEPNRLWDCLNRGRVAVVAGFQGVSETGEVTTLGRGGSDTTAAALAVALRAELLEIYTDVDGVKTADPRLVPGARTLDVVGYDETVQMAYQGARVIHPRAVEIARRNAVPIRIRSTFSDTVGTLVCHPEVGSTRAVYADDRIIAGVTHMSSLAQVTVTTPAESDGGLEIELFQRLADAGVSVDLINVSPGHKVFCIVDTDVERASDILREMGLDVSIRRACGKVSVVGGGMRGLPGVMARVVRALANARVPILQTADSHVTISCLVSEDRLAAAVQALHDEFGLSQ